MVDATKKSINIEHNKNSIFMPIDFKLGNLDDFSFCEILFNQKSEKHLYDVVMVSESNGRNGNGMRGIRYKVYKSIKSHSVVRVKSTP